MMVNRRELMSDDESGSGRVCDEGSERKLERREKAGM